MEIEYEADWKEGKIRIKAKSVSELDETIEELKKKSPLSKTIQEKNVGKGEREEIKEEEIPRIESDTLTGAVRELLRSDWGVNPRSPEEIEKALQSGGIVVSSRKSLHTILRRLVKRNEIRRKKQDGRYHYFADRTVKD